MMMRMLSFVLVALTTYGSAVLLKALVPKAVTTSTVSGSLIFIPASSFGGVTTIIVLPTGSATTVTFDPSTAFPTGSVSTATPTGVKTSTVDVFDRAVTTVTVDPSTGGITTVIFEPSTSKTVTIDPTTTTGGVVTRTLSSRPTGTTSIGGSTPTA